MCPRCRSIATEPLVPPLGGDLARCPTCGLALVASETLAESDGDPFLGTTIAGRFVVTGRLGAGSMGTVYRARQEAMGRDVAVKILRSDRAFDAQAKARFTREARATSQLMSPHTVTVFDFGEIPDESGDGLERGASLYLAMELLEGESLGNRLKRRKRLGVEEAVTFARHALLSLAEAHEKGIIHRDLKPDNLFLTPASAAHDVEICKVLDFGIAKVVTDAPAAVDALETQAGTVFGTPRYMSPEQAQGKALDARSDLYALGVLLYQMLVGRAPFVDDDAVVVMARHIKTLPVAPSAAAPEAAIPRALSDVVMRALMKDPGDRPATARAFVAELDDAIGRARSGRPPPRGAAAVASGALAALSRDDLDTASDDQRRHRRRRALAWASAGAALAVAAFGFALTSLHGVATSPAEVGLASEAAKDAARAADMTRAVAAAAAPASAPPIAEAASASATASAATPPPAVHQSAPAQPQQKRAQHYKRFDQ